jgi:hypothetical protein
MRVRMCFCWFVLARAKILDPSIWSQIGSVDKATTPANEMVNMMKEYTACLSPHAADLHLGYAQYGLEARREDFDRAFEELVNKTIELKPDL